MILGSCSKLRLLHFGVWKIVLQAFGLIFSVPCDAGSLPGASSENGPYRTLGDRKGLNLPLPIFLVFRHR